MSKRRVAYYYDRESIASIPLGSVTERRPADVGAYSFGVTHPMKPQCMRITHELLSAYDMLPKLHVLVSSAVG